MSTTIKMYRKERQTKLNVFFVSQKTTLSKDTGKQKIGAGYKSFIVETAKNTLQQTLVSTACGLLKVLLPYQ